jgi:RNA polymerase sigma factor (sigma-70 family)
LDLEQDLTVVQLAENGREALDKIAAAESEEQPDIILMDIRMPVMDGVECTKIIKQRYPFIKVIILTTFDDDEFIIEALKSGAAGYILKDLSPEKLAGAIRDAYEGNSIMQPEIAAKVISHISSAAALNNKNISPMATPNEAEEPNEEAEEPRLYEELKLYEELTEREREVLQLVGKGKTNAEISKKLFISEGTVKNYISNLYSKLQVTDRSKLTLYAIENRLV